MSHAPPYNSSKRPEQIAKAYDEAIALHLADLIAGRAEQMYEIEDFASLLCIHPSYLTQVIKDRSGLSACAVFQLKIIEVSHILLDDRSKPVKEVAVMLSFEASQFTKWFRRFHGITPKEYRLGKPYTVQY